MYRLMLPMFAALLMAAALPSELSLDGLPPLTLGMTVAQAGNALGKPLAVDYADESKACGQVLDPRYRTTSLMFVDGKLARIDVRRRGLSFNGVSVGSTEAEVRAAFPKLRVEPHKYTDGRYLNVKLSQTTGVVFETDKARITRFRLGTYPAVDYVEGCY
jgi:hypothetical protein